MQLEWTESMHKNMKFFIKGFFGRFEKHGKAFMMNASVFLTNFFFPLPSKNPVHSPLFYENYHFQKIFDIFSIVSYHFLTPSSIYSCLHYFLSSLLNSGYAVSKTYTNTYQFLFSNYFAAHIYLFKANN